jgi:hypothetical protein
MGWFGDLWKRVEKEEAVDMLFVPDVAGAPDPTADRFEPNKCYVELYVDSLRLRNARKFATRFHGAVYTYVTMAYAGGPKVHVPAISKPDNLAKLDPGGLGKVIVVNKQMMGAVPWRGGQLLLELGLFSVNDGNLLTPVLDFVAEVSSEAGVSFIGKVAPFAPLITKGMDMLAGQTKDVALEVGIDTALALDRPGTHAIIAVPKAGRIEASKLSLDKNDRKLLLDGQPLKEAYCVFSLKRSATKADYGEIPELKAKFAGLREAIRSGVMERADEALKAFRLEAVSSPDLIRDDALELVKLAEQMVKDAFGGGPVSRNLESSPGKPVELADMPLYAGRESGVQME